MIAIIHDFNHHIFAEKDGPFISIYQNTHKNPTASNHDILAFKNYLKTIEQTLKKDYDDTTMNALLDPLRKLQDNKTFWHGNRDAIAIFVSRSSNVVMRLNKPVKERVIIADSLHTKPLIRHFQTHSTFDVLTLNRDYFKLYTCTQDECHEVAFEEDTLISKKDVLGTLDDEKYLSHASYGGASNHAMYHGHEDTKEIVKKDTERYFRYVDAFIYDTYSKPTERPLILWTLPEHQSVFRKVSKSKYLIKEGVKLSDKGLTEEKIREKAWEIVEPYYQEDIKTMLDKYYQAQAKDMTSNELNTIAKKAVQGNIAVMFISADQSIPGKFNPTEGTVTLDASSEIKAEDVLDDLAEYTLQQGGSVYILDEEDMPTKGGISVIYRYQS